MSEEPTLSSQSAPDVSAFRAFERAGWELNSADYDAAFERLTSQAAAALLDAARVEPGTRLLDVATGPGYVAGLAATRGADVVGVDFSAPMLARARARHPGIEFREGDAESLEFPAGSFDAVVMNFGMLHLGQPERAMLEAARVLVPGGRFAFTVWAEETEVIGFQMILKAVQRYGNPAVELPAGPPFFRFSDAAEAERTLRAVGFSDVKVETIPQIWRFDAPEGLFAALYDAGVRIKAVLRAQAPEALGAIRAAVTEGARQYLTNGVVELPMPARLACALKAK